ncbi:hypothetical protein PQR37_20090 [Paraburkholderia nemoris]|uniref:hypothetical protein n=1 Tax=Paraburkholderia nemoris TaxID=2793076 RepID=UPI0038BB2E4F
MTMPNRVDGKIKGAFYAEPEVGTKEGRGMSFPELLDRFELASAGMPARLSAERCRI